MKNIIKLGRVSRKNLVVIHSNPDCLKDIRSPKEYVALKIDVHEIITTQDEVKYDEQYTVTALASARKETKEGREAYPIFTPYPY